MVALAYFQTEININNMKYRIKSSKLIVILAVLIIGLHNISNAQTPADDPGIGGPGIGAAPAGDGSPIVPFDGGMSLVLLASGIGYATKKVRVFGSFT